MTIPHRMGRRIEELEFAEYSTSPWPVARRGVGKRAAGLRYQAALSAELARRGFDFANGPWIRFRDANGLGHAQPDFVVYDSPTRWVVLEAKLSQTEAAFEQLNSLYIPLLQFLHPEIEMVPIQVCKVLRTGGDIIESLDCARNGAIWHWLSR